MSRWRTGRRVGNTIYRRRGPDTPEEQFVGSAISPELAAELVAAANRGAEPNESRPPEVNDD